MEYIAGVIFLMFLYYVWKAPRSVPTIQNTKDCKWTKWERAERSDGDIYWKRTCKISGIVQKTLNDPDGSCDDC